MASQLGIPDRQYLISAETPERDFKELHEAFVAFVTEHTLPWRGFVRNFGNELYLEIAGAPLITLLIPSDLRPRSERLKSVLVGALQDR